MSARPRLLILSFSDIGSDARVLRQVKTFAEHYEVVSCGFGEPPVAGVEHIRIATEISPVVARLRPYVDAVLVRSRLYRFAYWSDPLVRAAKRALRGHRFDAVFANDIEAVPLALSIARSARVHIDLHEFFPGLHDDVPAWNRVRKPYFEWLLRRYAVQAASATTVAEGLADAYRERYGLVCAVASNAGPLLALEPTPVHSPIRLVHSGIALPSRQLEFMMRAVEHTSSEVELDLYLMPNDVAYLAQLKELAEQGGGRVRVLDPLPYAELVRTLNDYDLGVFVQPPTSFNLENALPNKFFDFVQARLGVIIGPSPEMRRLLLEFGLGAVTADFSLEAFVSLLDNLRAEQVAEWKLSSHHAAEKLSAETQLMVWHDAVEALLQGAPGAAR